MICHTTLYASDLSLKKEFCAISYSPLNEDENEIRLISLARVSRESNLVHCHLSTVSLGSYTQGNQTYKSLPISRATKHQVLANWARRHRPKVYLDNPERDTVDSRVPMSGDFRSQWGDYAALSYVWCDKNMTNTIVVNGR
jgi:hypothetical protein